jgi:hypothetical protein
MSMSRGKEPGGASGGQKLHPAVWAWQEIGNKGADHENTHCTCAADGLGHAYRNIRESIVKGAERNTNRASSGR